jgi:hypothetical protein
MHSQFGGNVPHKPQGSLHTNKVKIVFGSNRNYMPSGKNPTCGHAIQVQCSMQMRLRPVAQYKREFDHVYILR